MQVIFPNGFTVGASAVAAVSGFTPSAPVPTISGQSINFTATGVSASNLTFTVSQITNPTVSNSSYLYVQTYDALGYPMDYVDNLANFVLTCTLPCKTCNASNTSQCASCYTNSSLVLGQVKYDSVNQLCISTCPNGTYDDGTGTCLPCTSPCLLCASAATTFACWRIIF